MARSDRRLGRALLDTERVKQLLMPLIAVRTYAPAVMAAEHQRQLRELQRRLAAARLGMSSPRPYGLTVGCEDLR